VKIEIWSDIVCPWCLIGKRRLERALEQLPDADISLEYRSFELDPSQTPLPEGDDLADVLARKYRMPRARAEAMMDHVAAQAAAEGVAMDFSRQARESGSFDAHRLLQLARAKDAAENTDVHVRLKDRLMRAWFCEGRSIRDPDSLAALAAEVGLPAEEVAGVLEDPDAYADAVRKDESQARALGITGVPFFVIDGRLGVSGAQPPEVMLQALQQAGVELPEGTSCGVEGC
jgi:predicted DsbA family dithiol-disulfide isomerase